MTRPYDVVVLGLSLSSSWGNGHATTFRSLLRGLDAAGQRVLFLEREMPWYATNRDLPEPDFCTLAYYDGIEELIARFGETMRAAGAVIVGSYVPDGVAVIDALARLNLQVFCFYDIDTPVTLGKLDRGDEDYLARRQIPWFDIYFSFSGGPVLRRLEAQYGAREGRALYCSVDEDRYRPVGEDLRWDLGYLGTYSLDRQPALEELLLEPARRLPQMRFVVAGPQYPEDIGWPSNVERIEHLPPADHSAFYGRQRFTLNVTRRDMIAAGWSPSVRLFEAAACGTPVISDYWEGLGELLPQVLIARSADDVVAYLSGLSMTRRVSLAETARALVLEAHTGRARARELIAALRCTAAQTRRQIA